MKIIKDKREIKTIDEWYNIAPPKNKAHWVEGRSAYECAKAWLRTGKPVIPAEIINILETELLTSDLKIDCVEPECKIKFDSFGGEPRNADLAFIGKNKYGTVAVNIEAKTDETYSTTLSETITKALETLSGNSNSKKLDRIKFLTSSLFKEDKSKNPKIIDLRYQLLTAVAGSLAYAQSNNAETAVLIIHEFITNKSNKNYHQKNDDDLQCVFR